MENNIKIITVFGNDVGIEVQSLYKPMWAGVCNRGFQDEAGTEVRCREELNGQKVKKVEEGEQYFAQWK